MFLPICNRSLRYSIINGPRSLFQLRIRTIVNILLGVLLGFLISNFRFRIPKENQNPTHAVENREVAMKLYHEVRVLCWVMTNPTNHKTKARHVKRTWGKRCNILLFMSTEADPELNTIVLPVEEGREHLWDKVWEAFTYIHEHYMDQADWFYKADDDTYAIPENMRFMLSGYDPKDPLHFGCKFKPFVKSGWMSGGSGYVLSHEAVRRLVEEAFADPEKCARETSYPEDVVISQCLENVDAFAGDSRDVDLRGRFFPLAPVEHLAKEYLSLTDWYWEYIYYPTEDGLDGLSRNAIAFHYMTPQRMYEMDYLIYELQPYGIVVQPQALPKRQTIQELIDGKEESDARTIKPGRQFTDEEEEYVEPVELTSQTN